MNTPNLFYSPEINQYLWIGTDECFRCHKPCSVHAVLLWDYWKHSFLERIFCFYCKDQILKSGGKYKEFKQVTLMFEDFLPEDALPVWPKRPTLATSKEGTVFEVATSPIQGVKTIDNTTLLARQSIYDATIGADMKAYLEEKDKPLSAEEGLLVLEDLKNAEPLNSRFELEDKEDTKRLS